MAKISRGFNDVGRGIRKAVRCAMNKCDNDYIEKKEEEQEQETTQAKKAKNSNTKPKTEL